MTPFDKDLSWIETHFVEVRNSPEVVLDLKYATSDNFMNENVYAGFTRCFLAPVAAEMFAKACERLRTDHPDLQFRVWDALRPRKVQAQFFNRLKGTPFESFVANPHPGSLHNFGMAMDLTLQTKTGSVLDMGTDFDDFSDLAQPKLEEALLRSGRLTDVQWKNRMILREVLEGVGFRVLPHEWWHFNALPSTQVHGVMPILE